MSVQTLDEQPRSKVRIDKRRTGIYVDARNLYKGLLKSRGLSWFDVERFLTREYPQFVNLASIKYFTSPGRDHLQEPLEIYHGALRSVRPNPKLSLYEGKTIEGERLDCDRADCPLARDPQRQASYKEKQTDVWMAVEILSDVLAPVRPLQKVVLITNDSDFVPLIKQIRKLRPEVDAVVYAPVKHRDPSIPESRQNNWICHELRLAASYYGPLRNRDLERYLLPESFIDSEGNEVRCPELFTRNRARRG